MFVPGTLYSEPTRVIHFKSTRPLALLVSACIFCLPRTNILGLASTAMILKKLSLKRLIISRSDSGSCWTVPPTLRWWGKCSTTVLPLLTNMQKPSTARTFIILSLCVGNFQSLSPKSRIGAWNFLLECNVTMHRNKHYHFCIAQGAKVSTVTAAGKGTL